MRDVYVQDINCDEIRDGFLVTQSRKKIWNKSLEIWSVFDQICQKYNIRYYADYGTLLGAVRHKGFIPWDDDLDFVMFRPEYERFLECAAKELEEPYSLQTAYTDIRRYAFAKIRDSRTTAVEFPEDPISRNQGMFVDIFPLDDVPDGKESVDKSFIIAKELWFILTKGEYVSEKLAEGWHIHINDVTARKLLDMPFNEKMKVFDDFLLNHYGVSEKVNFITDEFIERGNFVYRHFYDEVMYLPFEGIELPVPAAYKEVLTGRYGNYQEFVRGASDHENIVLSPDIPYKDYLLAVQLQ